MPTPTEQEHQVRERLSSIEGIVYQMAREREELEKKLLLLKQKLEAATDAIVDRPNRYEHAEAIEQRNQAQAECEQLRRELKAAERQLSSAHDRIWELWQESARGKSESDGARAELEAVKAELTEARERIQELESGAEVRELRASIADLEWEVKSQRAERDEARAELVRLKENMPPPPSNLAVAAEALAANKRAEQLEAEVKRLREAYTKSVKDLSLVILQRDDARDTLATALANCGIATTLMDNYWVLSRCVDGEERFWTGDNWTSEYASCRIYPTYSGATAKRKRIFIAGLY
jgi:chromosome segregation ATPase